MLVTLYNLDHVVRVHHLPVRMYFGRLLKPLVLLLPRPPINFLMSPFPSSAPSPPPAPPPPQAGDVLHADIMKAGCGIVEFASADQVNDERWFNDGLMDRVINAFRERWVL